MEMTDRKCFYGWLAAMLLPVALAFLDLALDRLGWSSIPGWSVGIILLFALVGCGIAIFLSDAGLILGFALLLLSVFLLAMEVFCTGVLLIMVDGLKGTQ
jgi:hypothetical protein